MDFSKFIINSNPQPEKTSINIDFSGLMKPNVQKEENTSVNGINLNLIQKPDRKDVSYAVKIVPTEGNIDQIINPNSADAFSIIRADIDRKIKEENKPCTDKKNNKKIFCWLTKLIEQKGEDYITSKLTVTEVSRNAARIIDDILAGRIDYTKYGKYIILPVIIETLINYCSNKIAIAGAIQVCLGYTYNDYVNRYGSDPMNPMLNEVHSQITNITQAISMTNQDLTVYTTVKNKLEYVRDTKNATSLFNVSAELGQLRRLIQNRY